MKGKLRMFRRFFTRRDFISNICQKHGNQKQKVKKVNIICNFCKCQTIYHCFDLSLKNLAKAIDKIPEIILDVYKIGSIDPSCGSIKTSANQPAARLTKSSEIISNQPLTDLVYCEARDKSSLRGLIMELKISQIFDSQIDDFRFYNYGLTAT